MGEKFESQRSHHWYFFSEPMFSRKKNSFLSIINKRKLREIFKKNWSTKKFPNENIKCRTSIETSTFINTSTTKKERNKIEIHTHTHTQLFTLASPWKIGLLRVKLCSRIHFGLVNYNGNLHKQLYLFNEQPPADVGGKDREEKMKRNRVTEKKGNEKIHFSIPVALFLTIIRA